MSLSDPLTSEEILTSKEVATILEITSPITIRNWIEGGHFPGSFPSGDGRHFYPLSFVKEVKRWMKELRNKNTRREVEIEDDV